MRDPAKLARKLLSGLFTLVIAPIVGQWFINLAESLGLYGEKLKAAQEALTSFFNWIGFGTIITAAAFLLGAMVGAWLNARLSRTQDAVTAAPQEPEQTNIQAVGLKAVGLAARIKRAISEYEQIPGRDLEQIKAETYALMVELRTRGFDTDEVLHQLHRDARALVFSGRFLTKIGPLLRDGHMEQAHVVAKDTLPTLVSALNGPALIQARSSRYGR
jgi:hypothetical protein